MSDYVVKGMVALAVDLVLVTVFITFVCFMRTITTTKQRLRKYGMHRVLQGPAAST